MLLLLPVLAWAGCVVHVDKDPNEAPPPPPPPPGAREPASESFMLKYVKKVPEVYEGVKAACARNNFRITDANTPGDDNWSLRGHHANGVFELRIHMNRHDHKSRTTVTVSSGRGTQFQCREWTRRLHAEIGRQIGEEGRD